MLENTKGTIIDPMQQRRINEHPFRVYKAGENATENFIINNNLEIGKLEVFENLGGVVTLQQLAANFSNPANAVSVADITIGALWQQEGVFIHDINCEYGYEYLIKPMLEQVVHFATFYECYQSVRISAREREKWFTYAGGILADFHQKGKTYIYQIR